MTGDRGYVPNGNLLPMYCATFDQSTMGPGVPFGTHPRVSLHYMIYDFTQAHNKLRPNPWSLGEGFRLFCLGVMYSPFWLQGSRLLGLLFTRCPSMSFQFSLFYFYPECLLWTDLRFPPWDSVLVEGVVLSQVYILGCYTVGCSLLGFV